MSPEFLSAAFGFLGGLIPSCISVYIYKRQSASLEKDELRRRKIEIIFRLLGARYVLSTAYKPSVIEVKEFNTAMALFTVFFSDSKEIMRHYDAYAVDFKNTDKLISLLLEAAKAVGLDLLDSSMRKVITINPQVLPAAFSIPTNKNEVKS